MILGCLCARGAHGTQGKEEAISAENVQILRDGYAAFARQDVPAVMAAFDENIEWNTPDSLPFGGTHRGHEGVGEFFGHLGEHWEGLTVEPQEFIDGGDTIVVLARTAGTGAGGSLDGDVVHLWRMRDGKAVSFTEFTDTARTLEALGQTSASTA
jgi:ketosteroid isomerase-like protein